jgi:nucleoside phosphorylase
MQWANVVSTSDDWVKRIIVYREDLVTEPKVHTEPVAAGSKVVANSKSHTFRLIEAAAPRAVAVEMEGAGFLLAVNRVSEIEGLLIRGISDCVDDKDGSDHKGWRHQAAANAAAFAFELLHQYQPPTQGTPGAA